MTTQGNQLFYWRPIHLSYLNGIMSLFVLGCIFFLITVTCGGPHDDEVGLGMQELEFLSEELSSVECQQLQKSFRLDKRSSGVEGGSSCLQELVNFNEELSSEGPDVVQSVFRHKLSQVGRPDLADWLSRVNVQKNAITPCLAPSPSTESIGIKPSTATYKWTYMDFAICTLATWTFLSLGWLVIQLIVIKMKAAAMASLT